MSMMPQLPILAQPGASLEQQLASATDFLGSLDTHTTAHQDLRAKISAAQIAGETALVQRLEAALSETALKTQLAMAVATGDTDEIDGLATQLQQLQAQSGLADVDSSLAEPETTQLTLALDGDSEHSGKQHKRLQRTSQRAAQFEFWPLQPARAVVAGAHALDDDEQQAKLDEEALQSELGWLDEPCLLRPSVRWAGVGSERSMIVRWNAAAVSATHFRLAYKHASWWMWQYEDCELGVTPDCVQVRDSTAAVQLEYQRNKWVTCVLNLTNLL